MSENVRRFTAGPDPFGRVWEVEFKWHQTGISIRHADTVDVKYLLWTDGEPPQEKVLALPHPALLKLSAATGHPLTDGWVMRLAASHIKEMCRTFEDWDKALVTLSAQDLTSAARFPQPV